MITRLLPELTTGPQRAPARSPAGAAIPAGVGGPRGRFLPELAGARVLRPLSGAIVLGLALSACDADHVAARAVLQDDYGLHGIAVVPAPPIGRPCAWGEPFAVRFRAVREDGVIVAGTLCASDEAAQDARVLSDGPEGGL